MARGRAVVVAHPPPSLPRKGGGVSIQFLVNEAVHILG